MNNFVKVLGFLPLAGVISLIIGEDMCVLPNTRGGQCKVAPLLPAMHEGVEPYTCAGLAKVKATLTGNCSAGYLHGFGIVAAEPSFRRGSRLKFTWLAQFDKWISSLDLVPWET